MKNPPDVTHRTLYRLPWNMADSPFSWLEPTYQCNLACVGCYRKNVSGSHKTMDEINHELDVFQAKRNSDCIMLAGGDPLMHPQIVDIVRVISNRGIKPYLGTNGLLLTKELLRDLKKAGLCSVGFHVDSKQNRGGRWRGKNEIELNELRLEYATMVAEAGDISCSFSATVYDETLKYLPELVAWAQRHIEIVHDIAFIAYRQISSAWQFQWFAGGKTVERQALPYTEPQPSSNILSTEMLACIRNAHPEFAPSAYLNGTEDVDSLKWLLTVRVGTSKNIYAYLGPKFVELVMSFHHFTKGTYLGGGLSHTSELGRLALLLLWPFDRKLRLGLVRMLRNPLNLLRRAHFQTIIFIQPIDFLPDGRQSMCDACPDMTVFNDTLVWSCRLEELKSFGTFLRTVPDRGPVVQDAGSCR